MKVLVLNGSPKKKSDTFRMTDAFLKGFNAEGKHEIHVINVIEKNIAPCRGCFGCWQGDDPHCVIQDDQNEILDLFYDAELVIWSFPLYCYSMPSHLKAVLDRTIPLVKMQMKVLPDGTVRHLPRKDFSKLRTLIISGCGFPHWEGNYAALRLMCSTCFVDPLMVCVPETPMMNNPAADIVTIPKLKLFEEAGAEYDHTGTLSAETVSALEAPMIPAEEYLKHINH